MSIVPYTNNKIVLRDPYRGLLVLHNNQNNSIELVTTLRADKNDFADQSRSSELTCPNCGFNWEPSSSSRRHSNNRDPQTQNTDIRLLRPTLSGVTQVSSAFMDHDYFKLLEKLPYKAMPIADDEPSVASLPDDVFNQGYFKRFFKQVPPYTLGLGAHAQVYKVIHVLNDIVLGTYAVKRISMGNQLKYLEEVLNEVLILYELSVKGAYEHNLIRYNHVWLEMGDMDDLQTFFLPSDARTNLGTSSPKVPYVFILQQYCDGGHLEKLMKQHFQQEYELTAKQRVDRERARRRSIRDGIKEPTTKNKLWLSELEIWKFFKDISTAVNYLHHHNILHRDLKPSNCLLDTKYDPGNTTVPVLLSHEEMDSYCDSLPKILVSDFGEGKFINKHDVTEDKLRFQDEERRGNTGTLEFTAPELWLFTNYDPEVIKNSPDVSKAPPRHTYESDIYSLGLILCWLCVGQLPFSHLIEQETDPQIIRQKILDWYYSLTSETFYQWFQANAKLEPSGCLNDFAVLVYAMIKDSEKEETPSRMISSDVLKYLEAMKREWFLAPDSRTIESDDEISDDDQIHDLTMKEVGSISQRKSTLRVPYLGPFSYIIDILLLQALCLVRPHFIITTTTLLVVIFLGMEVATTFNLAFKKLMQWLSILVTTAVAIYVSSSTNIY